MSHPFQIGVRGSWWVNLSKDGWGTVMSHPKGACLKGGGGLHQSQPRGGGGGQIMLMCRRSVNPSTNLSYTLSSMSYQVLIHTSMKWSTWEESTLPKHKTSKQWCPGVERGETWYFSDNLAPSEDWISMGGSGNCKASVVSEKIQSTLFETFIFAVTKNNCQQSSMIYYLINTIGNMSKAQ